MNYEKQLTTSTKEFHFYDSDFTQPSSEIYFSEPKPVVVILHGLFGGLSNFDAVIASLKHSYRFIALHLPFFEQDELQRISQLSDYVYRFLTEYLQGQHFHLIGNSLGGQIALYFAHKHPNLINSIVLSGSAGLQENQFGCSTPKRYDINYLKDRASEVFFDTELSKKELDSIQAVITTPSRCHRLIKLAKNSKKTTVKPILHQINKPVLLIWGEQDRITPPSSAYEFLNHLPHSELKWISRCGHAPMMENPTLFAHYCDEFFSTLAGNFKQEHLIHS